MKSRRAPRNWLVSSLVLGMNLAVGVMLAAVLFPKTEIPVLAASVAPVSVNKLEIRNITVGTPNRVIVNDVGIDIPVKAGAYSAESQTWTLGYDAVYHADRSVRPNDNNGTTLIYGHADSAIFQPIERAVDESRAMIYTDEGIIFVYTFASKVQVEPNDVSVFTAEGAPRLVLLTCSGPFDMYRTLVSYNLIEVRK